MILTVIHTEEQVFLRAQNFLVNDFDSEGTLVKKKLKTHQQKFS